MLPSSGCDAEVPRLNVRSFPSFSFVSNFIVLFFSFSDSHSSFFSRPLMMLRGRIFSQYAPGERERYSNTYWCSQNISNNVQHSETHAIIVKWAKRKQMLHHLPLLIPPLILFGQNGNIFTYFKAVDLQFLYSVEQLFPNKPDWIQEIFWGQTHDPNAERWTISLRLFLFYVQNDSVGLRLFGEN